MKLSIVTTMYCSAPYLEDFHRRISESAKAITGDYEIIFVNDGSPDNSLDVARGLFAKDRKVKIIDLSRNFGHHKAIMTGLQHARGDYVFLIDSDLEEKPELLIDFWKEISSDRELDVVFGQQVQRKGNITDRLFGRLFYLLVNFFSDIKISTNLMTVRMMSRRYVTALVSYREHTLFIAGIWAAAGFKQKPILIDKISNSPTTYSLSKKLSIIIESITSFSDKPLTYIFYIGCLITLSDICYIIFMMVRKLVWGIAVEGWTSIVASIWFLGGVIIFSLGVIGIYLSRIYVETKNRPYTIIKKLYTHEKVKKYH